MMTEFDRMEETLQKDADKKTVKTKDVPKPYHQAFHLKSTSEYLSSFTRNETFIQNTIDEEGFFVIVTGSIR